MSEMKRRPSWFPVICDAQYFASLREDYPERAGDTDEELHEYFNDGLKYQHLWDHVGDAYDDYEPLADAFLGLLEALRQMVVNSENDGHSYRDCHRNALAAIAKAEGSQP